MKKINGIIKIVKINEGFILWYKRRSLVTGRKLAYSGVDAGWWDIGKEDGGNYVLLFQILSKRRRKVLIVEWGYLSIRTLR